MAIPSTSTSRPPLYAAIPAIPPFPTIRAPRQQPDADPDELRRAKVERFAGLIAKKQQETDERYRKLLRSGQAPPPDPPEPPKPAVIVDEETLRRIAARERFREALAQEERKSRRAALFVQMARPEHLRELGIDQAMERPRDENGAPVLAPEHPCCPLEKLGYFLKADQ